MSSPRFLAIQQGAINNNSWRSETRIPCFETAAFINTYYVNNYWINISHIQLPSSC